MICRLSSCASQALGHRHISCGSLVVAHGLCCSIACSILWDQGLKLCLLHQQVDSLSHWESSSEPLGKLLSHFLGVACSLGLSLAMSSLSFSRLAWASLSSGKSLRTEIIRPLVAQALKLTWYYFCHILLVRTSCEVSPDSRDGERLLPLDGKTVKLFCCVFQFFIIY